MSFYQLKTGNFTGEKPPMFYNFKYNPDHFQLHGFKGIYEKDNILVTAHTGAGKTALALYAAAMHLSRDENAQVVYTGPIKTLINQKFKDFSEDFDDVGIMTGDIKINPSARLLVMTAEILRNAIFRMNSKDEDIYDWHFNPKKVKCVILDEVHFINNNDRGMVWEEIITNLDPSIQLVMLSATINGAERLAKWVGNIKKKMCYHIPTPFRPVPLKHFVFWDDELHLLLEGDSKWNSGSWSKVKKLVDIKVKNRKVKQPSYYLERLVKYLKEKNQLPANIFLLNKIQVERTANNINLNFNNHEDVKEIEKVWNKHLGFYQEIYGTTAQWNNIKSLACKGIGIHHSGLIPIMKEIVEILYEKKLIKVLIATETFAIGVNMPTKTTIFTNLNKFDGKSKRLLNTEEYIQMAGRAGRRGLDTYGTVVILPGKFMEMESSIKKMMTGNSRPLKSRISFDYNYILKQLLNYQDSGSTDIFDDYIINNINMTYFGSEIKGFIDYDKECILKLQSDLEKYTYDEDIMKDYIILKDVEEKLAPKKNSWLKLNRKVIKKLNQEKSKILKKLESIDMTQYESIYNIKQNISSKSQDLDLSEQSIRKQIHLLTDFLKSQGFVNNDDENVSLTTYGKIMAQVNECNPMILGYMLQEKIFSGLTFDEIVALLSIFIDDRSLESESIENLPISDMVKDRMYCIGDIVNRFADDEVELSNKLPYPVVSDWYLHTNLLAAIKEWAKGKTWKEIYHLYPTFEGNFIKNVLRLTNLIKNVYLIAKITKDSELLNTMEEFESKMIRGFVTTDSLYI